MSEQTTKPKAAAAVALTSAHVNAQIVGETIEGGGKCWYLRSTAS